MTRIRIPKTLPENVVSTSDTLPGPPMPNFMANEIQGFKDRTWCIAFYFNPLGYKSRIDNFLLFHESIQQATHNLLLIELAKDKSQFLLHNLHDRGKILRVVEDSNLWQKERLFNVAIKCLPINCDKVIWLDADILFENQYWFVDTAKGLEKFLAIQPYTYSIRLPPNIRTTKYLDKKSFPLGCGDETKTHGMIHAYYRKMMGIKHHLEHPGYCMGYRRDFLEEFGYYDKCISGSSDYLMAKAIVGDTNYQTWPEHYTKESWEYYQDWAYKVMRHIAGKINYVRRTALYHLYHGPLRHRLYQERLEFLEGTGFNHAEDLQVQPNGCYKLIRHVDEIEKWMGKFFKDRKDDDGRQQWFHDTSNDNCFSSDRNQPAHEVIGAAN
jgi:hypothetical protein